MKHTQNCMLRHICKLYPRDVLHTHTCIFKCTRLHLLVYRRNVKVNYRINGINSLGLASFTIYIILCSILQQFKLKSDLLYTISEQAWGSDWLWSEHIAQVQETWGQWGQVPLQVFTSGGIAPTSQLLVSKGMTWSKTVVDKCKTFWPQILR